MVSDETAKNGASGVRKRSLLLSACVAGAVVVLWVLGDFYYSGGVPLRHAPRVVTAPFRRPQRADTANVVKYERARFTFSYPGNWRVDTANKHYGPDSFLILDAPRRGQVRLQILDGELDAKDTTEQIAARFQLPGLTIIDRGKFLTWGQLDGHGVILSGKKLGDPFQVRIFAHSGRQSLVVWEYWWDGPESINTDGFKLIEDSFRFAASLNVCSSGTPTVGLAAHRRRRLRSSFLV